MAQGIKPAQRATPCEWRQLAEMADISSLYFDLTVAGLRKRIATARGLKRAGDRCDACTLATVIGESLLAALAFPR
jgi:hypothetical protein